MVRIAPFRGVRYSAAAVGDVARATAPPYDAIDEDEQRRLYRLSPHNVVRLELGVEREADDPAENRYTRASRQYREWREQGVLVDDDAGDALHVYEQRFGDGGSERRQVGLLAALELSDWSRGWVLPHERVFRGPVEDRKRLLRALPVNVSPVFVVHDGRPAAVTSAIEAALATPPRVDFACDDGVRHRTWPLTDARAIAAVQAELADRVVLMADGHHRYTTALEYRDEPGAPAGADHILAYVVSEAEGPVVRASHRLVRRLPAGWRRIVHELGATVERLADRPRPERVDRALERDGLAFGLLTREGTELIRGEGLRQVLPSDLHEALAGLDVTVLHHLLVEQLGVPDRIEQLRYTPDVDDAVRSLGRGDAEALFLVRPVTLAQVRAAAGAGVRMPPKSTSFHPKPRTGLILRPLDVEGAPRAAP